MRPVVLVGLLSLLASTSLVAQTIRGTVVDEGTKLPVPQVLLTLLDNTGAEILPGVRSDSLGAFILHSARSGTWRVRAVRIGYAPVTSDTVFLAIGGLAVVRLRMTTLAQQLIPVQIVEKRQLSANELMSTTGFDLRERRGIGKFLSGDRLRDMGLDGVGEVLATQFRPALEVYNDPTLGDVLRIRQGLRMCEPEIYLDGRLLATAAERQQTIGASAPQTAHDTMRLAQLAQVDTQRRSFPQVYAITLLRSLTASQLYGIEVYRRGEVPPPSLGAWFGISAAAVQSCGTVAVWTKSGAKSVVAARNNAMPGRPLQVISGSLVDYDTGAPLAGRPVTLLTDGGSRVGTRVVTDERGEFTIHTPRIGELRLTAGGDGYLVSTTPPLDVSMNELVVVRLYVSATQGVLAPLGVAGRVSPQHISVTSIAGFTFRRERAQGGVYLRASDIERTGARSLADLLRPVEGVAIVDSQAPRTVVMPRAANAPTCSPAYYLDGQPLSGNVQAAVAAIPMSRIFGVEVYRRESEIPGLFIDAKACGLIAIWTR